MSIDEQRFGGIAPAQDQPAALVAQVGPDLVGDGAGDRRMRGAGAMNLRIVARLLSGFVLFFALAVVQMLIGATMINPALR